MDNISENIHLKKMCVVKRGTRYFYPKSLPKERESMVPYYLACLSLILLIHLYLAPDKSTLISNYIFSFFIYYIYNVLFRICLLIQEQRQTVSHYTNNQMKLLKDVFSFNILTYLLFFLSTLYIVYYISTYGKPVLSSEYWYLILGVLCFLHRILDLDSNPINDSLNIAKGDGLNYGSGMAYSFFYGYLNYILPKTGDIMKNLKEMMMDYEDSQHIRFPVYKIFILIPKSLTCHVHINEVSKLMEMRSSLQDKIITVAGVRDRVYKNSVYSIRSMTDDSLIYVCTEYATPLKTFQEVVKNTTPHTEYYTRHKNDILLQFYLTLKQILEYEHMDSMCELVFYEDVDENNKFHDVGRILLNRIAETKKGI